MKRADKFSKYKFNKPNRQTFNINTRKLKPRPRKKNTSSTSSASATKKSVKL